MVMVYAKLSRVYSTKRNISRLNRVNYKNKIALCMIVAPTDEEAKLLDRCLGGVVDREAQLLPEHKNINLAGTDGLAKHVDKVFITITGKNELCEAVAKKYDAEISYFEWNGSFSDARNFNFSQASQSEYQYVIWTDSDDVWKSPKLIRGICDAMDEEAVDVVNLDYFYHFDEFGKCDTKHRKTRIIKNDNCVSWDHSELHEDFKPLRQIMMMDNKKVAVYHLTDSARVNRAMIRNTEIARLALAKHPEDPRSYWNFANCLFTINEFSIAIQIYLDFLGLSESKEERFLAWHRLSSCFKESGDISRAIECELEALALRPWYPDPYFGLGELYLISGEYRYAREFYETGFTKSMSENEMIAWNPRDYKYTPRLLLAETYMKLYRPDKALAQLKKCIKDYKNDPKLLHLIKITEPEVEKMRVADAAIADARKAKNKDELSKILDSIPAELKYYPPIVNLRNTHFIKTVSSGRDLVIFCGHTAGEWHPGVFDKKGVGGSEEAVIQLAKRWASAGWNVTVYANIGHEELEFDGVSWKPFMAWNYRDKQDVTIIWRHPKPVDYDINSSVILIDVHDVIPANEFTRARLNKINKVMFKSDVQRKMYDNIPDEKAVVIPHGLDITKFEDRRGVVKKNPYKIINTSSPDRSLLTSLEIIEEVYNRLPDELKPKLKFRWNYGFRVWDADFSGNQAMEAWKEKALKHLAKLKELGVVEEGSGDMISQEEIVDQYLESGVMLYPSEFFEIGFISGIKAILAGAIPATTTCFAQGEFLKKGIIVKSDKTYDNWTIKIADGIDFGVKTSEQKEEFINRLVEYIKDPDAYNNMREELILYAKENFDWDKTSKAWDEVFTKTLNG